MGYDVDLVIAGGGPAGMMAGLLFARAGVKTMVIEKHPDFLRDFRGDTVHASTLNIFHELGLLPALLALPHNVVPTVQARIGGTYVQIADFTHLRVPAPFTAMMPQWDLLAFMAREAAAYPCFTLRQDGEVTGGIEEDGRVEGVRLKDGSTVRARLTIAADGRRSVFRAGFPVVTTGSPMDVFWFKLPKSGAPAGHSMGLFDAGRIIVMVDRGDYWACAFIFPKGRAEHIRAEGLAAFKARVRGVGAETSGVDTAIESWSDVSLLTVTVDRLDTWHRPGLLVIGDAAHAMSPVGGVGINLAVQDAVAAANILAGPMARGEDVDPLLKRVEKRRRFPVRVTQRMQQGIHDRVVAPLLKPGVTLAGPPFALRLFNRFPVLRRIPGHLTGLGVRPEHVRSHVADPVPCD